MSRSVRHAPVWGNCCPKRSEKADKVMAHRAFRRSVKHAIQAQADILPHYNTYANPWKWTHDGKGWRSDWLLFVDAAKPWHLWGK